MTFWDLCNEKPWLVVVLLALLTAMVLAVARVARRAVTKAPFQGRIEKVEIVVTSDQSPSRIAQRVVSELNKIQPKGEPPHVA